MEKKKQKRMVCHLEYEGQHYYFGNLKVLTDNFSKELIGVGYKSQANFLISHDKFTNEFCTIRKGTIITSEHKEK